MSRDHRPVPDVLRQSRRRERIAIAIIAAVSIALWVTLIILFARKL